MNSDVLAGVHPRLVAAVDRILAAMGLLGFPMRITEGVRADARQMALYAQGRTAPGPIVTHCDGVRTMSAHQRQADGYGHAVDCCFASSTPFDGPWALYGAMADALGLVWGGTFTTITDRPHVELPAAIPAPPPASRAAAS